MVRSERFSDGDGEHALSNPAPPSDALIAADNFYQLLGYDYNLSESDSESQQSPKQLSANSIQQRYETLYDRFHPDSGNVQAIEQAVSAICDDRNLTMDADPGETREKARTEAGLRVCAQLSNARVILTNAKWRTVYDSLSDHDLFVKLANEGASPEDIIEAIDRYGGDLPLAASARTDFEAADDERQRPDGVRAGKERIDKISEIIRQHYAIPGEVDADEQPEAAIHEGADIDYGGTRVVEGGRTGEDLFARKNVIPETVSLSSLVRRAYVVAWVAALGIGANLIVGAVGYNPASASVSAILLLGVVGAVPAVSITALRVTEYEAGLFREQDQLGGTVRPVASILAVLGLGVTGGFSVLTSPPIFEWVWTNVGVSGESARLFGIGVLRPVVVALSLSALTALSVGLAGTVVVVAAWDQYWRSTTLWQAQQSAEDGADADGSGVMPQRAVTGLLTRTALGAATIGYGVWIGLRLGWPVIDEAGPTVIAFAADSPEIVVRSVPGVSALPESAANALGVTGSAITTTTVVILLLVWSLVLLAGVGSLGGED